MEDEVKSQDSTPVTGGLSAVYQAKPTQIKLGGKDIGLPTPAGTVLAGGTNQSILDEMQKLIDEREEQRKGFGNTMADALAWWSGGVAGPGEALAKRRAERQGEETDIFNLKMGLAQQKMAQQQAQAIADIANQPYGGLPQQGATVAGGDSGQSPSQLPGVTGTQTAPQYKFQMDADIATLPLNEQLEAKMLKTQGAAGVKEIYKMIRENNIKGMSNEQKINQWIQGMPENTPEQRDIKLAAIRQYMPQAMAPVSTWVGNQEVKSTPTYGFVNRLQQGAPAAVRPPVAAPSAPAAAAPAAVRPPVATPGAAPATPAAAPSAPAATKPSGNLDAAGLPIVGNAGAPAIGGGTMESTGYAYKQAEAHNNLVREETVKPMLQLAQKNTNIVPQINKALNALESTSVGPGTSLQKLLTETKGVFTNLSSKELRNLSNLRTLDSASKQMILSDAKGSLPGSFSDSDRIYIDKTGPSIDDPKEFFKASLQFKKAAAIANEDVVNYLNRPENAANISVALEKYKNSGRGMAILRKYAPAYFAFENEKAAAPSAAAATPKVDRDAQAREWLKNNPNDPDAAAVRAKLEGKK